ncbi:MAG: hypothetical protein EA388_00930 [Nitriliruptor sp.]|nr:MAG: hypothetical protein EA388_00930 [Nitriliruptor sp.]
MTRVDGPEPTPEEPHAGEDREGDATPPEDDDDRGAAGPRRDEGGQADLALRASGPTPTRPPRRTGVFLDPDDLRVHVGDLLRSILGGYEVDAFGNFTFTHEGARAFVTVGPSPVGPQVGVFSVTNLDVDLTPPLAAFLLETNHTLGFGAFSYDAPNRAVWLRYTLHGSSLDLPELQSAVAAVATTAAALDDTIRDRFGGRTFQESPEDVQRGVGPPDTVQPGRPPNASGYL